MQELLRNILNENGDEFTMLLHRMQKFNSNIAGSNAYFYKRKIELEALIEQEGMPTSWFTLSAADNHWLDIIRIIYGDRIMPQFNTEHEKAK